MSDRWMRYVNAVIRSRRIFVVAVCGLAFLSGTAFAAEQKGHGTSFDEVPISSPKDWHKIVAPADLDSLSMLADQMRGNFEKLRTWQGVYSVHLREYLPSKFAVELRKSGKAKASAAESGLWKESKFLLRFTIDIKSDSIYRSKETTETVFTEESNSVVTMPRLAPVDERSVVTAEHCLHFDPKAVWPGFAYVPDYPETRGKRTAFRDPAKWSEGKLLGDLPDPRMLFGLSAQGMKFWEEFTLISQGIKDYRAKLNTPPIAVYDSQGEGGAWYRMEERFMNRSRKLIDSYMIVNVSAATGFNVVSNVLSRDAAGEHPESKKLWQWKRYNGVFLPERTIELLYTSETGKPIYRREMKLQECKVNDTIAPSLFSYQGLGLKDGDVVMDNIDKVCYILRNGGLEKLANYGEKYYPPDTNRWALSRGWQLTICSSFLVVLIAIFVVRHCKRKRLA